MKTTTPPLHSYRRRFETARSALIEHLTENWEQDNLTEGLLAIRNATNHPFEFNLPEELYHLSHYEFNHTDHALISSFHRAAKALHRAELRTVKSRLSRAS